MGCNLNKKVEKKQRVSSNKLSTIVHFQRFKDCKETSPGAVIQILSIQC